MVDDNATNRRILTLLATKWGMAASETESPADALAWVEEGQAFDLALLDYQMPGMDGVELAEALRLLRAREDLRLVLLTSMGTGHEARTSEADFAATLTKPLKQSQLFDTLVRVMTDQPAPAATRSPAAFDPGMAGWHPLRILLAEDNQINMKLTLHLLGKFGYGADVAGNGAEALAAVERQHYDVVLMDVQMPVMDGCEATRQIRRRWPEVPRVVALTANAMDGDREECLAAGMNDYIGKPISPDALAAALRRTPVRNSPETAVTSDPAVTSDQAMVRTAGHVTVDRLMAMLGDDAPVFFRDLVRDFLEDGSRMVETIGRSLRGRRGRRVATCGAHVEVDGVELRGRGSGRPLPPDREPRSDRRHGGGERPRARALCGVPGGARRARGHAGRLEVSTVRFSCRASLSTSRFQSPAAAAAGQRWAFSITARCSVELTA